MRFSKCALAGLALLASPVLAQLAQTGAGQSVPSWVLHGDGLAANVDLDFANGLYWAGQTLSDATTQLSITRASQGTDLLPTSASGASFATYNNNVLRIKSGSGLLIEESRINQLLNSTAPVTQTTASLGTATYTLWVNGAGSATMSAGTGTGCGTGTASNGTPVSFTITIAGTCTVTVTDPLNAFQLEAGAFGTSLIVTAGTAGTRAADVVTLAALSLTLMQNNNAGSVFLSTLAWPATPASGIWLTNNGNTNRWFLNAGSNTQFRSQANGVQLTATLGGGATFTANTAKIAIGWDATGRSEVGNNGTGVTDANSFVGVTTSATLGATSFDTYIPRLAIWNSRLSDAGLKGLTQ